MQMFVVISNYQKIQWRSALLNSPTKMIHLNMSQSLFAKLLALSAKFFCQSVSGAALLSGRIIEEEMLFIFRFLTVITSRNILSLIISNYV